MRCRFRPVFLVLAVVIAAGLVAPARALNIDVTHYRLANGMEIVILPDHRAPVVTHMVWYKVGSADEPRGKAGIAHFLEHLLFKGTKTLKPGEFSKIIERNGGNDNAFTTRDFTAYYARIASDRLELVMKLEADRIANLQLTDKDVKTELAVVREERRSRTDNNPTSLFAEQMAAMTYIAHPYRKPVIGWMDEVARLTRADAVDFYRTYYTPANAIVVIAGDVDVAAVKALVARHYAPLRNTANPGPRLRTREPKPIAARRIFMADPRAANTIVQRRYLAPSNATGKAGEGPALDVLAEALGGSTTSRLYRDLVIRDRVAAYAGAGYSGDALDYGVLSVYLAVAPGVSPKQAEARLDEVIADVLANGLDKEDIERAKRRLIADTTYDLDSQFRLAYIFGAALTTGQSVNDVLEWTDRINAVTADQVKAVAAAVMRLPRSVTGVLTRAKKAKQAAAN